MKPANHCVEAGLQFRRLLENLFDAWMRAADHHSEPLGVRMASDNSFISRVPGFCEVRLSTWKPGKISVASVTILKFAASQELPVVQRAGSLPSKYCNVAGRPGWRFRKSRGKGALKNAPSWGA